MADPRAAVSDLVERQASMVCTTEHKVAHAERLKDAHELFAERAVAAVAAAARTLATDVPALDRIAYRLVEELHGTVAEMSKALLEATTQAAMAEVAVKLLARQVEAREEVGAQQRQELLKEIAVLSEQVCAANERYNKILARAKGFTAAGGGPSFGGPPGRSSTFAPAPLAPQATLQPSQTLGSALGLGTAATFTPRRPQSPRSDAAVDTALQELHPLPVVGADVRGLGERMQGEWDALRAKEEADVEQAAVSRAHAEEVRHLILQYRGERQAAVHRAARRAEDAIRAERRRGEGRARQLEVQLRRKEIEVDATLQQERARWAGEAERHAAASGVRLAQERRESARRLAEAEMEREDVLSHFAQARQRDRFAAPLSPGGMLSPGGVLSPGGGGFDLRGALGGLPLSSGAQVPAAQGSLAAASPHLRGLMATPGSPPPRFGHQTPAGGPPRTGAPGQPALVSSFAFTGTAQQQAQQYQQLLLTQMGPQQLVTFQAMPHQQQVAHLVARAQAVEAAYAHACQAASMASDHCALLETQAAHIDLVRRAEAEKYQALVACYTEECKALRTALDRARLELQCSEEQVAELETKLYCSAPALPPALRAAAEAHDKHLLDDEAATQGILGAPFSQRATPLGVGIGRNLPPRSTTPSNTLGTFTAFAGSRSGSAVPPSQPQSQRNSGVFGAATPPPLSSSSALNTTAAYETPAAVRPPPATPSPVPPQGPRPQRASFHSAPDAGSSAPTTPTSVGPSSALRATRRPDSRGSVLPLEGELSPAEAPIDAPTPQPRGSTGGGPEEPKERGLRATFVGAAPPEAEAPGHAVPNKTAARALGPRRHLSIGNGFGFGERTINQALAAAAQERLEKKQAAKDEDPATPAKATPRGSVAGGTKPAQARARPSSATARRSTASSAGTPSAPGSARGSTAGGGLFERGEEARRGAEERRQQSKRQQSMAQAGTWLLQGDGGDQP